MDQSELYLEQYKMMEERRSYFGKLFWQLPGFFIAVFAVFVGLASNGYPHLLRVAYVVGGAIFLLIAWIAYRLRVSQDECESVLAVLEGKLRDAGFQHIISLPRSRKYGARAATIFGLLVSGVALLLLSIFWDVLRSR